MHHLLNTLACLNMLASLQTCPTCLMTTDWNQTPQQPTLQSQSPKAEASHTAAKWRCPACTHAVELLLLSACRNRDRAGLYTFQNESEMLTWLAVFNKAVAAVVVAEGYQHMQLHDYHGALDVVIVLQVAAV